MARRAEKKQATRDALIRVATELFCRQGYDRTVVDEIVAAAGVSQRTFFRYFPSKLDVAFPNHRDRVRHMQEALARHFDAAVPIRGIRRAMDEFSGIYAAERDALLGEFRYVSASPDLLAHDAELDRDYENAIADTLERAGVGPRRSRILAGAIFGGIRATTFEWLVGGCREDLAIVGHDMLNLLDAIGGR